MHQIVIIGSGFAGLTAVKTLRKQGCRDPITLISPRPVLFYYPSLIWVPAGLRDEQDLTVNIEKFLQRHEVKYHPGNVIGLDIQQRQVKTDNGFCAFDSLIVATGARFLKKIPGIEQIYIPCEGYESVKVYSDRLAALEKGTLAFGFGTNPKEPSAMRGGALFEFLFGIDTLLKRQKRRAQFELVFFSPAPQPGKRLGEKAVQLLMAYMAKLNIKTHLGHKITGFDGNTIKTEGGEIHSDLTLFMPGMTGPTWIADTQLPLSEGGLIQADAHCRVPGTTGIYIAGDCGSFPGPDWLPKQAHISDAQAETAAKNLIAERAGQPIKHTFKVDLICIIDSLNKGILVYRSTKRNIITPNSKVFHWAKTAFERHYLRGYR